MTVVEAADITYSFVWYGRRLAREVPASASFHLFVHRTVLSIHHALPAGMQDQDRTNSLSVHLGSPESSDGNPETIRLRVP